MSNGSLEPFLSDHFGADWWDDDEVDTGVLFGARRYAALALRCLMRDLSEGCWCAGWMNGTEYALWEAAVKGEGFEWGAGLVSDDDAKALQLLARASGVWWAWKWNGEDSGEVMVPLSKWREALEVHHGR